MEYVNLYGYGCSHTVGTTHGAPNIPYISHISKKIGIENTFNRGENSSGNQYNRTKLINDFFNDEIKKNSLIIFQLTQYQRRSYQLIHESDIQKFYPPILNGNWGKIDGVVNFMTGMFDRNDSECDIEFANFVNTYYERLSGDHYLMFDDIFSTYSVLKFISSEIKNIKFLMIAWPEIKPPFEKYLPLELSNIWEWSNVNNLTENYIKNNGDYHLSQTGHEMLADKILKYLHK